MFLPVQSRLKGVGLAAKRNEPSELVRRGNGGKLRAFASTWWNGERIVHLLSWHRVQSEKELGEALRQVKEVGLIPEEPVLARESSPLYGRRRGEMDLETRQSSLPLCCTGLGLLPLQ